MWIINKYVDVLLMSVSSILIYFLLVYGKNYENLYFYMFYLVTLIDSCHVFLTVGRIRKDYNIDKTFFIVTPIVVFLILFFYQYFQVPNLWTIFLYFAFFHFVKQNFGISRWYMAQNNFRKDRIIDHYVFLTTFLPFVMAHFREGFVGVSFNGDFNSLFLIPDSHMYQTFVIINIFTIITYFLYELKLWFKDNIKELGRVIFLTCNLIMFNILGFYSNEAIILLIAFLTAHSIQYFVLNFKAFKMLYKMNFKTAFKFLIPITLFLGVYDIFQSELIETNYYYMGNNISIWILILVAISWTPLLTHYILDMKIWTKEWNQKAKELDIKRRENNS